MSLTKEVHRLMKTVHRRTDGQVSVEGYGPEGEYDDWQVLTVTVAPNAGLYKGGRFTFKIWIRDYPNEQPAVWCESDVYHPNIDTTECRYSNSDTNVCLNLFEQGTWDTAFGLETIVQGLLFLMHNPNFDDPLSPLFEPCNVELETENVRKFMAGENIDGKTFELELVDGHKQETDENKLEPDVVKDDETNGDKIKAQTDDDSDLEDVDVAEVHKFITVDGEIVLVTEEYIEQTDTHTVGTADSYVDNTTTHTTKGNENNLNTTVLVTDTTDKLANDIHVDPNSKVEQAIAIKHDTNTQENVLDIRVGCVQRKPGFERVTERVLKKFLTDLQYIGGKVLACFNDRYI